MYGIFGLGGPPSARRGSATGRAASRAPVARVQRRFGLPVSGRLDPLTQSAISREYPTASWQTAPAPQVASQLLAPNAGTMVGTPAPITQAMVPAPSSAMVNALAPQASAMARVAQAQAFASRTSDVPVLRVARDVPGPAVAQIPASMQAVAPTAEADRVTLETTPGVPFTTDEASVPGTQIGGFFSSPLLLAALAAAGLWVATRSSSPRSNPRRRRRRRR